ncbi:MAG: universal stress protein [Solirubrobacteraceae bacterium]
MGPTIVVDFHDADRSRDALALAWRLGDLPAARLVTVSSYDHHLYSRLPRLDAWFAAVRRAMAAAGEAKRLLGDGPAAVTRVVAAASPAQALREVAERVKADLIVIGSAAGTQPGRVGAGEVGRQLAQGASCAVAVAPAGFAHVDGGLSPVGVGFDGSRESRVALAGAASAANSLGSGLRVISVVKRPVAAHPTFARPGHAGLHDQRRSEINQALDALPVHPAAKLIVTEGEPTEVLLDCSRELGLLVLGSRGYGPLRRVLLGSVSSGVLDRAASPVMIVPRGAERPAWEPGGGGSSANDQDLTRRR